MQQVSVWRGKYGDPVPPFGPLPGVRSGNVIAYEFRLPDRYRLWPGLSPVERTFILTDVGVGLSFPTWRFMESADGQAKPGIDAGRPRRATWYVDLLHVTDNDSEVLARDLYIDVMIPTDGRHQRMLDLDEFADAIDAGDLPVPVAVDGLRRWQRFLDAHVHADRDPAAAWTDFPPAEIAALAGLPGPLGPIVTAP